MSPQSMKTADFQKKFFSSGHKTPYIWQFSRNFFIFDHFSVIFDHFFDAEVIFRWKKSLHRVPPWDWPLIWKQAVFTLFLGPKTYLEGVPTRGEHTFWGSGYCEPPLRPPELPEMWIKESKSNSFWNDLSGKREIIAMSSEILLNTKWCMINLLDCSELNPPCPSTEASHGYLTSWS